MELTRLLAAAQTGWRLQSLKQLIFGRGLVEFCSGSRLWSPQPRRLPRNRWSGGAASRRLHPRYTRYDRITRGRSDSRLFQGTEMVTISRRSPRMGLQEGSFAESVRLSGAGAAGDEDQQRHFNRKGDFRRHLNDSH